MNELKYTVLLPDICNTFRRAMVYSSSPPEERYIFGVKVRDEDLVRRGQRLLSSNLADLIDLATAVYIADRVCPNKADMVRRIHIILPVRNLNQFTSPIIRTQIEHSLFHFTHDQWEFEFTPRNSLPRSSELQSCFGLKSEDQELTETALWSGGLDSLAGLLNRMRHMPGREFTLVGAGSNSIVLHQQRQLQRLTRQRCSHRTQLVQIPMDRENIKGIPNKNSELRARGFVFLLLGALAAINQGESVLHVYENGIGALNLPFSPAEVGLDHTRAVNPLSLFKMENLMSALTEQNIQIKNPFQYMTKVEMCEVFHEYDDRTKQDLIRTTVSCDRPRRSVPRQCGTCSSCLLRRQSLRAAGIEDPTRYFIPERAAASHDALLYFFAMSQQVQTFSTMLKTKSPWVKFLQQYHLLARIARQVPEDYPARILPMFSKHVDDWQRVAPSLLKEMTDASNSNINAAQIVTHIQMPFPNVL